MKKVLIIGLTERLGGVETFIYNTTINSDKSKIQYEFLIHGAKYAQFQEEITNFYNNDKEHFHFVSHYKKKPITTFIELCKFYRMNKYDIIHIQTGATFEIVYCFPFALWYKTQVIVHSHNGNGFSWLLNAFFRPILNYIANIKLACSKVAACWLFGEKFINETIIINNGINVERFAYNDSIRNELRKKYNVDNCFVIGHIGRYSEQKNHLFILKVFKEILKRRSNSILFLVGTGELQNMIISKANQLKINNKIIYIQKTNSPENLYSLFDVFLMPSLYEGLPIVGIEAQCSGVSCYFSSNISQEINITDCCHIKNLSDGAASWADDIIKDGVNTNRQSYSLILKEKGFDIKQTVSDLLKLYDTIE